MFRLRSLSVAFALLLLSVCVPSECAPIPSSPYVSDEFEVFQFDDSIEGLPTTTSHLSPMDIDDEYRTLPVRVGDFDILSAAGEEDDERDSGMKFGWESMGLMSPSYPSAYPSYTSSPYFGSNLEFASSKKRLPTLHLSGTPLVAPSVELKPVTSYVVREQPMKAPRTVIQPIIHQRIVEQPITKTRIITQPVIRRLITQPVIQPHLIQTTAVREKIIDQPITVPRVTRQDIVKQVLVEQPVTAKPITRPTIVERRSPKVSTVFLGKNTARPLSKFEAQLAAHPDLKFSNLNEEDNQNVRERLNFNWMY